MVPNLTHIPAREVARLLVASSEDPVADLGEHARLSAIADAIDTACAGVCGQPGQRLTTYQASGAG